MPKKIYAGLLTGSFLVLILLSVYSYSQIDLNLTLSGNSAYQSFQNLMIVLGYFRRPVSALIFFLLTVCLFFMQKYWLFLTEKFPLSGRQLLLLLVVTGATGAIAYPAFSHDFFNYLFDARIVTKYHLNPYLYTALDFPDDLWTRFMHWTHRTYPYGPVWLMVSIAVSYLGRQIFVLTMAGFKLMFFLLYLGNTYLIGRISLSDGVKTARENMLYFALSPLVIIESLVSPHNESMMLFFLLIFFYYYFQKRIKGSLIFLSLSALVKYLTTVVIPLVLFPPKKIRESREKFLYLVLASVGIMIIYLISLREAYPWYFLTVIGIVSLIHQPQIRNLTAVLSWAVLLRYLPYLYSGTYTELTAKTADIFLLVPLVLASLYLVSKNLIKS
ncbi:MAG: hypothetical protein UV73_C0001G0187 [Candidatus Gottesmanbacteria bacterium GW2011_GWA2_43_14]|uniref:Uncharacterized protein n=1 Tax=Candidatus Gottesmanbacteria bacterium GW2011_GWA2_43_14 TaxID=1618443 RepID=A0A0G1FUK6_9BACT|nr:MAG: hypothetical protein UV73_C0001G0187 [Candidatus Gottesmanbacteria bacterium GW2011_GWA2_43_14]